MPSKWKISHLIQLVRRRYPDWSGFSHAAFQADEIEPKQATVTKAAALLHQSELDRLLAAAAYSDIIERLQRLARHNNLLWQNVPSAGDTAVLHHPNLQPATFCVQMRNLLYGDLPSAQRLQAFSDYLDAEGLPNKWAFPTYYLFICYPQREMFVKPNTAVWLLKFMGEAIDLHSSPTAAVYEKIQAHASWLREELASYGATGMVDVQSFIWVAYREGKARTGRLDAKGQIDLDIPPQNEDEALSTEEGAITPAVLREPPAAYEPQHPAPFTPLSEIAGMCALPLAQLVRWKNAIQRKKQAIFYGPPGVGKTFLARQMAAHLSAGGFWELVQFHPAYAYEDFVQGLRPLLQPDGQLQYELKPGRFLDFCARAAQQNEICVLIIDEINRANLSSVFGELLYLLEHRNEEIPLAAGGRFHIPANVRILGTMNTADRSIALVDHALRRRFAFIHLTPNYDLLRRYHAQFGVEPQKLIAILQQINRQIDDPHYAIGHTFFLVPNLTGQLADIWQMEIEPLLEEYFFDRPDQVETFRWEKIQNVL